MTLVACSPYYQPQPLVSTLNAVQTIDAADEISCNIIPITKAGNIAAIHWNIQTHTTGATVDVRAETLGSTGLNSGTLWAANTNGAHITSATGWQRTVLTAVAAVVRGSLLAVVVKNPTVSFGNMAIFVGQQLSAGGFPYDISVLTSKQTEGPGYLLEYDDGSFHPFTGYAPFPQTGLTMDTTTNPDEIGFLWTQTVPMRVAEWGAILSLAVGADWRANLYISGNNTPVLTTDYDGDTRTSTSAARVQFPFSSTYTLVVGTAYRFALLPKTTADVTMRYWTAPTGYEPALDGIGVVGARYCARNRSGTTDPDAAAWDDTLTTRMPMMWLVGDQIDDGVGGGGAIYHGAMAGGLLH